MISVLSKWLTCGNSPTSNVPACWAATGETAASVVSSDKTRLRMGLSSSDGCRMRMCSLERGVFEYRMATPSGTNGSATGRSLS